LGIGAKSNAAAVTPRSISLSDYQQLVPRIREAVRDVVPPGAGATVLVVSRGDEELVKFEGITAWHFMRGPDGRYVGYHPADSEQAIAHLEELRADGADYLVVPSTAYWWLEHYDGFFRHLDRYGLLHQDYDCLVFHLVEGAAGYAALTEPETESMMDPRHQKVAIEHFVASLLPAGSATAFLSAENDPVAPAGCRAWRPTKAALGDPDQVGRAALGELTMSGAEFVVIPRALSQQEWVRQLIAALEREHRLVMRQKHVGEIYGLRRTPAEPPSAEPRPAEPSPPEPVAAKRGFWQKLGLGSAARDAD
jgi:hypothetical protein